MQQQHAWYTRMWSYVEKERRDMPMAAHFVFGFVKKVLECGMLFTAEMYFAMLGQIEQTEYVHVLACLIVKMAAGIAGVTRPSILSWFQKNRGEVPVEVAALCNSDEDAGVPSNVRVTMGDVRVSLIEPGSTKDTALSPNVASDGAEAGATSSDAKAL